MQLNDPRTDRYRAAVYQAEDLVAKVMARASRSIRLHGRVLELPAQRSFATLASMQQFVNTILSRADVRQHFGVAPPVEVRASRGFRRATYAEGRINIPMADPRGRWAMTETVLVHELAHHLVSPSPGHGPHFQSALTRLYRSAFGADAATLLSGLLEPLSDLPEVAAPSTSGNVAKVASLLAKAQSTTNDQEADAYLAKATLLAQKHRIDLAVAALARPDAAMPTHRMLSIGEPRRVLNKALVRLLAVVCQAWNVRMDIGPSSCYALLYGHPADLDQVESVYVAAGSLMVTRAAGHVSRREWDGTFYRAAAGASRPVTAQVARDAFLAGFTGQLAQKLGESTRTAVVTEQPASAGATSSADAAVALRARELAVTSYYRQHSRARGSWRGPQGWADTATMSRK